MSDSGFRWIGGALLALIATSALAVGPTRSGADDEGSAGPGDLPAITTTTRLSLVIPVFDPGLGDLPRPYHKDKKWDVVFDEVRRTEANLLAVRLRDNFARTGAFDKVRVTPTAEAIGELYVEGRIMRSTSEDLHLEITVTSIDQHVWFKKIYKYRVDSDDVTAPARMRQIDPYQPLYDAIVEDVVTDLARRSEEDIRELRGIGDMVFAASYSEETFGEYLGSGRKRVKGQGRVSVTKLRGLPAADDPQYERILAVRAREELFLDDLQPHYDSFVGRVQPAYQDWQDDAYPLAVEARTARQAATKRKVGAGLLAAAAIGLGIAGSQADGRCENGRDSSGNRCRDGGAKKVGATVAVAGSSALAYTAFRKTREYKAISSALGELGDSVNIQLASSNVEFEGRTQELQGDAAQQYREVRRFLREVYAQEQTPDVQLEVMQPATN